MLPESTGNRAHSLSISESYATFLLQQLEHLLGSIALDGFDTAIRSVSTRIPAG